MDLELVKSLAQPADSKIVLLVMDGLGDVESQAFGGTALEAANTPNLDQLAARASCGLHEPVGPGITPGSGPAHLALFGYDPLTYQVGRGVLSALGIGFDLQPQDIALRGNFCTLDEAGRVIDRRAGRLSSEKGSQLCELLGGIELSGAELHVQNEKEYRLLVVLRGAGLSPEVSDTDPGQVGLAPLAPQALTPDAEKTAGLIAEFVDQARRLLKDRSPANMVVLRGCARRPDWPLFEEVYGLRALAIASYPMYLGLASLLGMSKHKSDEEIGKQIDVLEQAWAGYDFFFIHVKATDAAGEDGDFQRKVRAIEAVDRQLPRLLDLGPDVLIVTGDHSTPASMRNHSWHPVPVVFWSRVCRVDAVQRFGETACVQGALGPRLPTVSLMPLAMGHAGRLQRFGA
ncbi:MAG: 2,3-bisphosphoglycerate-independent phosphoglycerate mutase [Anaerolineae bacterium]|nr:2,3-bisphosphoglycerate-independent phosphoglycerate mutase [Anaerolineae bacterium]